jgi:hypothetical protein
MLGAMIAEVTAGTKGEMPPLKGLGVLNERG